MLKPNQKPSKTNNLKPILIEVITDKLGNPHFYEVIIQSGFEGEYLREIEQ